MKRLKEQVDVNNSYLLKLVWSTQWNPRMEHFRSYILLPCNAIQVRPMPSCGVYASDRLSVTFVNLSKQVIVS